MALLSDWARNAVSEGGPLCNALDASGSKSRSLVRLCGPISQTGMKMISYIVKNVSVAGQPPFVLLNLISYSFHVTRRAAQVRNVVAQSHASTNV